MEIRQDRHDFGNDIQPRRLRSLPGDAHAHKIDHIFAAAREMPKLLCMQNRLFLCAHDIMNNASWRSYDMANKSPTFG